MNLLNHLKALHGIILAAVLVLALWQPGPAPAATFSDDFTGGLRPAYWSIVQSLTGFYTVDASHGNIQLAKATQHNLGGIQYVFIRLNLASLGGPISGDFETQVNFSHAVVPGPGLDQVELHAYFQDGSIFYDVYDNSIGYNAHVWDGSAVQGARAVGTDAGTFLIRRTGSTVTGYFNGLSLFSATRGAPLTAIDLTLQNNASSDDAISVTFDDFSVTADSIPVVLNITPTNGAQVQLAWTTNSTGYLLEQTASLTTPSWTTVTNTASTSGDQFVLTLGDTESQRYFRLHKP